MTNSLPKHPERILGSEMTFYTIVGRFLVKQRSLMFGIKKTIIITQEPRSGYVAYVRKDTGEEIGRTEKAVKAWAKKNNVNVKFDGFVGHVTSYP